MKKALFSSLASTTFFSLIAVAWIVTAIVLWDVMAGLLYVALFKWATESGWRFYYGFGGAICITYFILRYGLKWLWAIVVSDWDSSSPWRIAWFGRLVVSTVGLIAPVVFIGVPVLAVGWPLFLGYVLYDGWSNRDIKQDGEKS